MLDLTDPPVGFFDDPYPHYAQLQAEAPILARKDGSFVLSRFADLDRIYRDTTVFSSDKKAVFAPKFGESPLFTHHTTSLVFNDPPLHTRVRKIMVGALTPRAIARMEPGLQRLIDRLLDDIAVGDSADVVADFASLIPINIIGNLFEMPMADRAPLRDWSLAILGALEPTLSAEQLRAGNDAVTAFAAYLADLARERRKTPGNRETDVLTRLIQSEHGELSEVALVQNCIFILNAGHETTTNLIANAIALLGDHEHARARLLAHPDLISTLVDEVLRYESPNQLGNRVTTKEVELGGITVPAGRDLHLVIGAANRDPAQYQDPQEFDPTRTPNRHLAFAGGPHSCVGLNLARLEGRLAINGFVARFPAYRVTSRQRAKRLRFRGFDSLIVDLADR